MKHSEILQAGKARFTLIDNTGKRRWSFQVTKLQPREEYGSGYYGTPAPVFVVGVLTGSDNTRHYSYLGTMRTFGPVAVRTTAKSKFAESSVQYRAANWALKHMLNNDHEQILNKGFEVKWAGTCARCGRVLTVPSSIDSRLGPECAKHF